MIFTVELPLPPSANNMFTAIMVKGKQRRIISREYKAWRKDAGEHVLRAWNDADKPTIGKPYQIQIELNVNHQSDIFNREKAITDLLVATIPGFPDDCWINRGIVERNRDIAAARVEVVTL